MKQALIVYDSVYGNTEQIARAIGDALGAQMAIEVLRAGNVESERLTALNLLVVGSPTQGGRATPAIQDFLGRVSADAIRGVAVAAFDTRLPTRLVGLFGYAAGRIASSLTSKGGTLIAPPEGFVVRGREGPLREGELERSAEWARRLTATSWTVQ